MIAMQTVGGAQGEILVLDAQETARAWAERRYIILRMQLTEEEALRKLGEQSEAGDAGETFDYEQVLKWSREDRWEKAYRAARGAALLASDQFRSDIKLKEQSTRLHEANEVLARVYDALMKSGTDKDAIRSYRGLQQTVLDLERAVSETEHDLAHRFGEQLALPQWRQKFAVLESDLLATYGGKGPQYRLLCRRLAAAEVRMQQLEASGVPIHSDEYESLTNIVRSITNQLQKFTEVIKTELIRDEVNDALAGILVLIERIVAPRAPELWADVISYISENVGEPVRLGRGDQDVVVVSVDGVQ